ncbi:MAG: N-acetylneuraminate synthase family protein [Bacteroidota bacterium]
MAERKVKVGNRFIGDGEPTYVIAEIGINHNGSLENARKLIEGAAGAGCDAVKFQKRTPDLCVPQDQRLIERDTPWGRMTYIDYRYKVEFSKEDYEKIDQYCKAAGIDWLASCWDEEAVNFIEQFETPFYKVASASLTDEVLLKKLKATGKPLMLSTGMSTMEEIVDGVALTGLENLMIAHSTSTYPCKVEELNLKMITTLREQYPNTPIGYSGHEVGLAPTWAAVVLGASFVERHITLDRAMWGTDQAASVEIGGFERLVSNIRDIEAAMGDGVKKVYDSEVGPRAKLRRVQTPVLNGK